jgi:hypothetical protein
MIFALSKNLFMKKFLLILASCFFIAGICRAQQVKSSAVPSIVKANLLKEFPTAKNIVWEKEDGNYEANWGGKSGEDNSVQLTPTGEVIEYVKAIAVSELPKGAVEYVKTHYKGAKITEAGKVTNAKGKISYEAEVNKKDILFDDKGNFVKAED